MNQTLRLSTPTLGPRAIALSRGARTYFTGKPCKRGHISKRYTAAGTCCQCAADRQRQLQAERPEVGRALQNRWRKANPDKVSAKWKRWADKNKGPLKERLSAWRKANPDKVAAQHRNWIECNRASHNKAKRQWAIANPDKVAAWNAARRAQQLRAIPTWSTPAMRAQIRAKYRRASYLTKATGVPHAVDHIVPLLHPRVCGLHVPWNLRVITKQENIEKLNRLLPNVHRISI